MDRTIKVISVEGVKGRKKPTKHYVYSVKVTWSDGQTNVVCRRYSEFFELQEKLKEAFPMDAGKKNPKKRIIPTLQAKKVYGIKVHVSMMKKLERITDFTKELILLPVRISQCDLVLNFFKPNSQDIAAAHRMSIKPVKTKKNGRAWRLRKISKKLLNITGPMFYQQYRVIADFEKQFKSCLSMKAGSIVEVIEKHENGWWFADGDGEQGWVPSSYLENLYDADEEITTMKCSPDQAEIYVSTRAYTAALPDELSFDVGVLLQVTEKTLDGWWKAIYHGREGMVPSLYITRIGDSEEKVRLQGDRPTESGDDSKPPPTRKKSIKIQATKNVVVSSIQFENITSENKEEEMSRENLHKLRSSLPRSPLDECGGRDAAKVKRANSASQTIRSGGGTGAHGTAWSPLSPEEFNPQFQKAIEKATSRASSLPRMAASNNTGSALMGCSLFLVPGALEDADKPNKLALPAKFNPARRFSDTPIAQLRKMPIQREAPKPAPRRRKTYDFIAIQPKSAPHSDLKGVRSDNGEVPADQDPQDGSRYYSDTPEASRARDLSLSSCLMSEADSPTFIDELSSSSEDESDEIYTFDDFELAQDDQDERARYQNSASEDECSCRSSGSESGYAESDNSAFAGEQGSEIYVAIEDYNEAVNDNELNLTKGEEVRVLRKTEGGWWYVTSQDGEGWAPSNYLEEIPIYLPPPPFRKAPSSYQEKVSHVCPIHVSTPEPVCYLDMDGEQDLTRLVDNEKYEIIYKDENGYVYAKTPEKYKWIPNTCIREIDEEQE